MKQLFCVLGDPIAHSRSPAIHTRAFEILGVDAVYAPCRVAPEKLGEAVRGLRALGASGFNVTVPHKGAVAALCDRLGAEAQLAGAVNCVVRGDDQLVGHNTDGFGLLASLRDRGVSLDGAKTLVLGAGGAARAAALALAGRAAEVNVINRDLAKAKTLSLQLRAAGVKSRATALGADEMNSLLSEAQVVVQCTSIGMGTNEMVVNGNQLNPRAALVDLVYAGLRGAPLGETALVSAARARGLQAIDGIDVLVHQAIASLEIWLGRASLAELFPQLRAAAVAEAA